MKPNTAVFQVRHQGFTIGDDLNLEVLNELREVNWRYTAMHFEGGSKVPFPERVTRSALLGEPEAAEAEVTLEELIPEHVRALLRS